MPGHAAAMECVAAALTLFWLAGMMILHTHLWLPWLCLMVAMAVSTATLTASHGPPGAERITLSGQKTKPTVNSSPPGPESSC